MVPARVSPFTRVSELGNPKHDQGGKPDELKKPARAHFGNDGPGGHYHKLQAMGLPEYTFGGIGTPFGAQFRPVTLANFRQ